MEWHTPFSSEATNPELEGYLDPLFTPQQPSVGPSFPEGEAGHFPMAVPEPAPGGGG